MGAMLSGFGASFATEAIAGALPVGRNSPQRPPFGLYAEQFSGTAFTVPRHEARRSWLYRIRPSALTGPYTPIGDRLAGEGLADGNPNRLRWDPWAPVSGDFLDGVTLVAATAPATAAEGVSVYVWSADRGMTRVFSSADGELLIVPWQGRVELATECGRIALAPGQIAVVPRGMRFRMELLDPAARGYMAENHGAPLRLPELGPIGSNGLANARDFETPVAWFEDRDEPTEVVQKFAGALWGTTLDHSPLDVVAWHGTNAPYRYDLARFNTINTVSFDHPDPSIFTVLTSPTAMPGIANMDFVVFPPRWMVAENTFRPPWFHRNVMNECMGLITGAYDARAEGFVPGGLSLHPRMSPHGPDAATTERAMAADLAPHKIDGSLAFMVETGVLLRPSRAAMSSPSLQADYDACWAGLQRAARLPR